MVAGLTVAAVGKLDGAAVCFFFSVQRHQSRCLLSSSSVCSSCLFLPSPRLSLLLVSVFFFVCFLLSLYFFFFISPSLFSLCSPLFFFLPFCFSVVFIFSMVLFVSLETSLPYQYLLLLYNISLRSFTVFSSLFFPLFFSFLLLLCVFVLFFLHPFLSKISPLVILSSPVFIDRRREQLPCLCPILETG